MNVRLGPPLDWSPRKSYSPRVLEREGDLGASSPTSRRSEVVGGARGACTSTQGESGSVEMPSHAPSTGRRAACSAIPRIFLAAFALAPASSPSTLLAGSSPSGHAARADDLVKPRGELDLDRLRSRRYAGELDVSG